MQSGIPIQNRIKLHLKLVHTIQPELWKRLDAMTAIKAENEDVRVRNRHRSKLERLINNNNRTK
jgi:hypothetical protein